MTGFGEVHPLPGIWDSLHLDSAITLPYGAYALRAWLSASTTVNPAARRFACWSAIASLLLGPVPWIMGRGRGARSGLRQRRRCPGR